MHMQVSNSRATITSSPSKRNPYGNRTASLRPLLNSFAVSMDKVSPIGIYRQRVFLAPLRKARS